MVAAVTTAISIKAPSRAAGTCLGRDKTQQNHPGKFQGPGRGASPGSPTPGPGPRPGAGHPRPSCGTPAGAEGLYVKGPGTFFSVSVTQSGELVEISGN